MVAWCEFFEAGNCGVLDLGRLVARLSAGFVFCFEIPVESPYWANLCGGWFRPFTGRLSHSRNLIFCHGGERSNPPMGWAVSTCVSPNNTRAFRIPGPRAVLVPMLTGGERCVRSGTPQMPIRVRGGRGKRKLGLEDWTGRGGRPGFQNI